MSYIRNDIVLSAAKIGNVSVVEVALRGGAHVDGSPEQPCAPIVAATMASHTRMVNCLLAHGADPDRPVTMAQPFRSPDCYNTFIYPGERALHIAANRGNVEIVRLLLKRSRADPNAINNDGGTPLMANCRSPRVCVEVVELLLEAGADPAVRDKRGITALHSVAYSGRIDLVVMLHARAPATLNHCASEGGTPLYSACYRGHESLVSKLLSLGAMQPLPLHEGSCPLATAVSENFVGVVRVLMNEGGIRAVGGEMALANALVMAIRFRRATILRLLLTVDGEEGRSEWANTYAKGNHLLHLGAGYCSSAAVGILLEAGADETARNSEGRIPLDGIGLGIGLDAEVRADRGREVAIRRMLQRGPAYRARSWAWPSGEEAHAGGSGDGGIPGAAGAAAAVLSSPAAAKNPPVIGMPIFRPKEKSRSKFFARLIGRCCAKN
ncbi:unnamed protein product [Laminaria digitata]